MNDLSYGDTTKAHEYTIKAAFVYKFAKFIEWPKGFVEKSDEFILCVIGENNFNSSFLKLNGKKVRGEKISVKFVDNLEDIGPCHIAFVVKSKKKEVPKILSILNNQNTLTVSDIEGFNDQGGMINFVRNEQNVSFELNVDAVKNAGLILSSKLIRVAASVTAESK